MKKGFKKGTILVENIIFIILNLLFLTILVLFLVNQGRGVLVLEQTYSKQIAMLADSAKPVMLIKMDMEEGKNIAEKNKIDFGNVVRIEGNIVQVKLSTNKGYSYAFFNDVDVSAYAERDDKNQYTGLYIITINEKGLQNE
jgi:hypothetical protein